METIGKCTRLAAVLVAIAALASAVFTVTPAFAQSVATQKPDYVPGEVVIVTGTGWQAGETVTMLVTSSDPLLQPDFYLISKAGADGSFTNNQALLGEADLGLAFTLSATGESSGATAQTNFTDPPPATCGNGTVETGEQCDDGNTTSGDGCSSTCRNEPVGPPASCSTTGTPQNIEAMQTVGTGSVTGGNGSFTCDTNNPTEWHFIINQVESPLSTNCPASLSLTWSGTCNQASAPLTATTGGACHYSFTSPPANAACLTDTLTAATTSIYPNWSTGGICGNGQFVVSHVPCQQQTATSDIVTEIHRENTGYSAGPPETNFSVVTSVTMGATIHDKATVTTTVNNIPASSSVTFNRFNTADCTGTAASTQVVALTGGSMSESVESSSYLVLASNIPALSYNASFTSGNPGTGTGQVPSAGPSACEPLDVKSSITGFSYTVPADNPTTSTVETSQSGNCILEQKTDTTVPPDGILDCPAGTSEATVTVGISNTYEVTVTVGNNTGVTITEKVQGGLAANSIFDPAPNVLFSAFGTDGGSTTCGDARINLSKAKGSTGNEGNVIIWNADGSTNPANPGFSMADGATCTLKVKLTKKFSSCGQQPVTSSWSELQTLVDGPNAGFSEKSPYTGRLSVNVVGCP